MQSLQQLPDTVCLFRLEDAYVAICDDAVKVANYIPDAKLEKCEVRCVELLSNKKIIMNILKREVRNIKVMHFAFDIQSSLGFHTTVLCTIAPI